MKPAKRTTVAKPVTAPVAGSIVRRVAALNRWRDNFNPLRGLTITRAVALLEAFARGEFTDLMWTYAHPSLGIETLDADLSALITRRLAAIRKLDWNIKTVSDDTTGFDQALAEKQAARLREIYEGVDNLSAAVEHLCLSTFRGFSLVEKWENADGDLTHLEPVNHWNLVRDGSEGGWKYNPEAQATTFRAISGEPLPMERFILRETMRPVNPLALIKRVRASAGEKDWDGFVEIYGIPGGVVVMPPNVPAGKEAEYEASALRIAEGGSGALPNGSDWKPNTEPRGTNPFKDRLDYLSEKLILAGTGGKLTMLAAPTGIGSGPSEEQADVFEEIAQAEAMEISELLQGQIDLPALGAAFPGEPVLAYFSLAANEETDTSKFVADVKTLSDAGFKVSAEQVEEKTGYEVEEKAAPVVAGDAGPGSRPPSPASSWPATGPIQNREAAPLLQTAMANALGVSREWLSPLLDLLDDLERKAADGISDAEMLDFMRQASARLPELFEGMKPEVLAAELEAAMGTAVIAGVTTALRKQNANA